MHALIVLAHPEEKSFNAQLAADAREALTAKGYTVDTVDLYRDGFDPLEDARHFSSRADNDFFNAMIEQRHASDTGTLPTDVESAIVKLERADLVVFQFPLWWWSVPAILKGWFDRVFAWGRVYSSGKRYPDRGHFKGKRALVSVTTGAPGACIWAKRTRGRSRSYPLADPFWPRLCRFLGPPSLCKLRSGQGTEHRPRHAPHAA